jgi:hypothetical protein
MASFISGTSVVYASGGQGYRNTGGLSFLEGGSNTGNGGGAVSVANTATTGYAGGSGIVIIRYQGNTQWFTGGTLSYDSVNNYTVHSFYSSGTLVSRAPSLYGTTPSLTKSLRFRSSNSAYMSRTPSVAGNRKTWTWSGWVKRTLQSNGALFSVSTGPGAYQQTAFYFTSDSLRFYSDLTISADVKTSAVFRDTSAWYHFVCAFDTTQATASDRVKIYVNGVLQTALSSTTYPTQSTDGQINSTSYAFEISRSNGATFLSDYLAEVNFIDGQQLTPQAFGQYDATSGVWQPMTFVGTYGTNGFYLPFTNTTSTTTLGYDSSGNGNNLTTSGFSLTAGSTYDSMNDVPTLTSTTASNYAVLNVNAAQQTLSQYTLSAGNLTITSTDAGGSFLPSTILLPSSGKFYFEYTCTNADGGQRRDTIGLAKMSIAGTWLGNTDTIGYDCYEGKVNKEGSLVATYSSWTNGDVVSVAIDCSTGYVWFAKNGSWQAGSPSAGTGATATLSNANLYAFAVGSRATATGSGYTVKGSVNFGQQPFAYSAPTDFVALNTYNLPTPTIVRGNQYFDTNIYPGNGGTNAIMNAGSFQPDLVWIKSRTTGNSHALIDSVRGAGYVLASDTTSAEANYTSYFTSFASNGFNLANGGGLFNANSYNYVAWQWKAGGTAVSNTSGTITSSVSANTTSGFSIVTYTGNSTSGATIGHGLGVAPSLVIVKGRNAAGLAWCVYSSVLGGSQFLFLNANSAVDSYAGFWNNTNPSSTVVTLGNDNGTNGTSKTYVAYCFAPIAGFSAFGSFTGNGSTTGPFVYTGFKPRWIMMKSTNITGYWVIFDTARNTYNAMTSQLWPNAADAENNSYGVINALSNGFNLVNTTAGDNDSGATYIYACFAESPFKYSNAR